MMMMILLMIRNCSVDYGLKTSSVVVVFDCEKVKNINTVERIISVLAS